MENPILKNLHKSKVKCVVSLFLFIPIFATGTSIDDLIVEGAVGLQSFNVFQVESNLDVNFVVDMDMILSVDQFKESFGSQKRGKRKAIANENMRWPNRTVIYEILGNITSHTDLIKAAIQHWEEYTCLRFVESSNYSYGLQYQSANKHQSFVGKLARKQAVYLNKVGLRVGIIVHETGHAIGFFHEHSRPDRDSYIRIEFGKVPVSSENNYRLQTSNINDFGIKYDYLSTMHYSGHGAFITLDPAYQDQLGNKEGLSFKDIKLANLMYNCASDAGKCPDQKCPLNGFVFFKPFKGEPKCECFCESENVNDPLVHCSSIEKEAHIYNIALSPKINSLLEPECSDHRQNCAEAKAQGLCETEPLKMYIECKETCGECKDLNPCTDHSKFCVMMSSSCTDEALKSFMKDMCPKTCKICTDPQTECDIQLMLNEQNSCMVSFISKSLVWLPFVQISQYAFFHRL